MFHYGCCRLKKKMALKSPLNLHPYSNPTIQPSDALNLRPYNNPVVQPNDELAVPGFIMYRGQEESR